ncbi:ATP synthase mitochondrial F1 complex assembly factor 2 [Knufia obscura]|uniref:ATP synthase mitochondrial F1 complex assembly factor 2 n=1 Tax=Knufia obscura TaxID=1635080 RepID=A0ABR0RXP3_9EURO|nr:ATP synthase mitochondrial F1 complex assembly factor 2 [Knufia obscura]
MSPSKESQALAEHFKQLVPRFPADGDPFMQRVLYEKVRDVGSEAPGVTIEDITIFANGLNVPCKWFKPEGTSSAKHVILFMHGGGFSFGSPDGHRKLTAHLAHTTHCPAISPDYRLSPEHPYPAALDDCLTTYQHLLTLGYDPTKIILAGDSCGGGLSASLPLAAIQRGLPVPGLSIALSPAYDWSTQTGGTMDSNKDHDLINTAPFVKLLSDRYVQGSGVNATEPLVSPLLASDEDLRRMPPTWISVAGHDMLRDHGERMAKRLRGLEVEVVLEVQEGQQHVMEFMVGRAPEATGSIGRIGEWARGKVGG